MSVSEQTRIDTDKLAEKAVGRTMWETDRYKLVEVFVDDRMMSFGSGYRGVDKPPTLKDGERIVSMAAHPMGLLYLVEKEPRRQGSSGPVAPPDR